MLELITDRTQADVDRIIYLRAKCWQDMTDDEHLEWISDLKGAYNDSDMNRVGEALNYLRDRLAETAYLSRYAFEAKTNWTAADLPSSEDLKSYLSYVAIIRKAMARYAATPPAPEYTGKFDYLDANNIEKILLDVNQLITNMLAARYYCGDLFCGEV